MLVLDIALVRRIKKSLKKYKLKNSFLFIEFSMAPKQQHKCNICYGYFPKFLMDESSCLICKCRLELHDEILREKKKNAELEDKVSILEARLESLTEPVIKTDQTHQNQVTVNSNRTNKSKNTLEYSIPISNRYSALENDEEIEVYIVGDSQVRNIGPAISKKRRENNRKSKKTFTTYCYPGATSVQIDHSLSNFDSKENIDIVLHVGGNEIRNKTGKFNSSEEILDKYKIMLEKCKSKSRKTVVTGILPRLSENEEWLSRALALNTRIKYICKQTNLEFLDIWDTFYNEKSYFTKKGIHLNNSGTIKLSDIMYQHFCRPVQGN